MVAYEFLAYDKVGAQLQDVTDMGTCIWDCTEEQASNAEALISSFEENGAFDIALLRAIEDVDNDLYHDHYEEGMRERV